MNNLAKILTVSIASVIALCCVAGCNGNSGTGEATESSTTSTADNASSADEGTTESADESTGKDTTESSAGEASVDLASADYSNPAVTIEFGDFELIQTVTQDMQTGKYDGQVIKVTGISEKRMSNCTVLEKDESTGNGYGMSYYLDGQPDLSEYPDEEAKVELLGVVTVGEYDVRALTVLPDKVTVLDS